MGNFVACMAFTLLPNNDGQPLHITQNDPGGATNEGLTYKTYLLGCASMGRTPSMDDFKSLTATSVLPFYALTIWNPIDGNSLPVGIDNMVNDFGVTSGPGRSAMLLQIALGFTGRDVDGWIGPETLKRLAVSNPLTIISSLASLQLSYYRSLATYVNFGNGWDARTYRRRATSFAMTTGHNGGPPLITTLAIPAQPTLPHIVKPVATPASPGLTADDLNAQQLEKDSFHGPD